jgi:AAA15 family ATPase/GTPase
MIRSLRVENFRGIKKAEARRLQRLNIVTGRNAGGKTTFLEAVYLNSGGANAELALKVAAFRGDVLVQPESDRIFRSCFNDMEESRHVQIFAEEVRQARLRSRSLTIEAQTRNQSVAGRLERKTFVTGIRFRFRGPAGEALSEASFPDQIVDRLSQSPSWIATDKSPLKITTEKNEDIIFAKFISPYVRDVLKEMHDDLALLLKEKSISRVIRILSIVQKDIQTLVPITEFGEPNIYVDIGRSQLLPIAVLGSGFFHLLRLGLAISQVERGIILIDELEDGLHYSILFDVAKLIIENLEHRRNLQIFISTHSSELIKTFLDAARSENFSDLCIINMSPSPDGISTKYFDREEMQYAIDLDAELR